MRKTALFLIICLLVAALCSCTTASDAKLFTTQGDSALEAAEYESALEYYKKALDTGTATNKVKALCEILSAYIEAKEAYENENFSKAENIIEYLEYDYTNYSPINDDMRELIRKIDLATQSTKRIDRALSELAEAIGESDYDTAYELINELDGYTLDSDQKEEFNYQIDRMHRKQGNTEQEETTEETTPPEEAEETEKTEKIPDPVDPHSEEKPTENKPITENKPSQNQSTPTEEKEVWYRVRKSWDDPKSQIHALKSLENAKKAADENPGYKVFDEDGNCIYP